jgi:pimeloyl-ACP methyl ester carboxylesterase
MRTVISGKWKKEKPIIVVLHGYGGSAALNYRIIQPLIPHFNLIMFDNIGMGGSTRASDFSRDFTAQ